MNKTVMKLHGFIDLHTHGIGRYDTRTKNPEQILKMAELHGKAGTSAILPTIYSGPIGVMRDNMDAVRKAMEIQQGTISRLGPAVKRRTTAWEAPSIIIGVHLEGPFLNPLRCGALDKGCFIKPTLSSLKTLIAGHENIVKTITIAPEIPGALRVVEKCVSVGITVNMGHSDATYRQAVDGKMAGATGITHLFNAMRPLHHREPGLAGFGLLDEDIFIEVIADGVHLHPETIRLIFRVKNGDRVVLVSDSVKGAGGRGKGIYTAKGTLAGSGRTISHSTKVLARIGITTEEILRAAVYNPWRLLTKKSISGNLNFPLKPPM
ncbi:MAG: amidohydrolase family protein [Thermodesulfovibrionales bacterium]|jgi:N-acetylglucosamine-6-phosphate deacetylase